MATCEVVEQLDFMEKVRECSPSRYEMWYNNKTVWLVPKVTSANIHLYYYSLENKEELEEVKKLFIGNKLSVGVVKVF